MSLAESDVLAEPRATSSRVNKKVLIAAVVGTVVVLDFVTKMWAMNNLTFGYPVPVVGDFFRFTYTHNPGAAFGINIGEHSRLFFLSLSLAALVVLGFIYRSTPARDRLRLLAVALVSAGAIGNIIDRFRFEAGVVDFLDVGIGVHRWPIFNVADMAVSIGAVLLLISFYFEEKDGDEPEPAAG
ncbi:MAG: signal peptidase II [Gemmatimonadetes bacterium]|nr:signal peptidase II [Gemmatimonadota bacterium]NNK48437.1 signal peptidase II [Gemmatimonadota bacterium]